MEGLKNKKKIIGLIAAVIIVVIAAIIIYAVRTGNSKGEEPAITAMYVPFSENGYIFVSQEAGVFTVTFPEEIYGADGSRITKEQLEKGNMVKIYGDGIMLESYPGQYPGVTKIEVIKEGNPSDADEYQDIIDQIYQEPDPAEPPTLNVEYTTDLAVVMVVINRGGYEWSYIDKDGLSNAVVADASHVLTWKPGEELADIKLTAPVEMTLYFSEKPQEVKIVRYDSSFIGTLQEIPEGKAVAAEEKEGEFIIPEVTAGYVYEVTGIWENGRATYGFMTVD